MDSKTTPCIQGCRRAGTTFLITLKMWRTIPGTFWIGRLKGNGAMVNNEKENVGIAGVASRLSDEVSDHFSLQIPAECKRTGYIYKIKDEIYSGKKGTIP